MNSGDDDADEDNDNGLNEGDVDEGGGGGRQGGGEGTRSHVKDFINVLATNFGETMLISLGQRRLPDS